MAYIDRTRLARDREFVDRIQHAMLVAAVGVLNQATPPAERLALAKKIVVEPERYAQTFAFGVVANSTVEATATDADLQTAVNATLIAWAKSAA